MTKVFLQRSYPLVFALWICAAGVTISSEPTEILSVKSTDGEFTALSFGKSDKFVACGTSLGNVLLIDVDTGKTIAKLTGNSSPVTSICCHSLKNHLIAADETGTILRWQYDTWIRQADIPTAIRSPQKILADDTGNVFVVGVSRSIVQRSQGHQGTERMMFGDRPSDYPVFAVAPDLSVLADGGNSNEIRFWDFKTGKFLKSMRNPGGSTSTMCFSPDSSELVLGSYSPELYRTKVDKEDWQTIGWYGDETETLHLASYSPDGKKLIVSPNGYGLELFANRPLRLVSTFGEIVVNQAAFAPSGRLIAVCSGKGLTIWRVPD